jgi:hypothetical protein
MAIPFYSAAQVTSGSGKWWNFSLMRKYPVELQSYGVLKLSVMGYEIPQVIEESIERLQLYA